MKLDAKTHDYFAIIHKNCNSIEFTFDKKNSLYIPLFNTCIDHCLSIHLLEKQNLVFSCLALARPMIESYLRAMWVKYCLPEGEIDEGCTTLHFPNKLEFMLEEIAKKRHDDELFNRFKSSITTALINMHDYTHTGIQSISRQYGNDCLTNENCVGEISELKKMSILVSSFAYEELAPFMDNSLSPNDIIESAAELIEL
ncbi:MAG: hypothetical protein GYB16_05000 [Gammaproteobacteria bacterium]|jgi:hypothetical protein|nr:hypothetical protein [Gammaproteobacteria bacterium]MEA3379258.1 hypothetical protein [Pseudomonadota bacterium]